MCACVECAEICARVSNTFLYLSICWISVDISSNTCWHTQCSDNQQRHGHAADKGLSVLLCSGRGPFHSDVVYCSTCDTHRVPVLSAWCLVHAFKSGRVMSDAGRHTVSPARSYGSWQACRRASVWEWEVIIQPGIAVKNILWVLWFIIWSFL